METKDKNKITPQEAGLRVWKEASAEEREGLVDIILSRVGAATDLWIFPTTQQMDDVVGRKAGA